MSGDLLPVKLIADDLLNSGGKADYWTDSRLLLQLLLFSYFVFSLCDYFSLSSIYKMSNKQWRSPVLFPRLSDSVDVTELHAKFTAQ